MSASLYSGQSKLEFLLTKYVKFAFITLIAINSFYLPGLLTKYI